ncbi:hypothetical protein K7X08_004249 [Anisodus acutangulus]|uniref:AIG1-type G domain-containing protein n=1 Tax=Anisodus acutangulus TaxID=402998 RepID=A0A9Q1RKG6_9SOLA|nr:hypothetical protein K7X08_004249 [Anisodus acutangulus]
MGGSSVTDDLEVTTNEAGTLVLLGSPGTSRLFDFSGEPEVIGKEVTTNEARTLVLLGRTGNGKSTTGNSILGRKAFTSKYSSAGVTSTCELQSTRLDDGLTVNVIDTPGLFDFSGEHEVIGKEIVKCMDLAKDGIHAVLLVLSVRTRFSREEQAAIQSFQEFFGEKIRDYMVFVFTGGDELEDNDQSLDDYLGNECPEPLKETIKMCDNRLVLFDNKTKDPKKKTDQLIEVLSLVNLVLEKNGGVPYTNELFKELQALKANSLIGDSKHMIDELKEPVPRSYEEQLSRLTENVTSKFTGITSKLLEQWAIERADRVAAELKGKAAQEKIEGGLHELREQLERAKHENEICRRELERAKHENAKSSCHIL